MFINESAFKVEMTADEYKKAMTPGTKEHEIYREIRRDYPGIRAEKIKPKKNKNDFSDLKFADIEDHVMKHGSEEQKKTFSELSTRHINKHGELVLDNPFTVIKEWFLNEFQLKKTRKETRKKIKRICEEAAARAESAA